MTPRQAQEIIEDALLRVVPDADLAGLATDADVREVLEMDSLDFLGYVETLSATSGLRIEEDDYPAFTTVAGGAGFLAARAETG
ncbi:hypothetical protein [Streptosporangium sp. NPDC049644]|uniref:hypothetical protein n=1 Tax=Streptosporangium sp. NPDC049644 TaxID=3155507 RepID=UPI003422B1E5